MDKLHVYRLFMQLIGRYFGISSYRHCLIKELFRQPKLIFYFSDKILKLCPLWDRLDPIFRQRPGMLPPYVGDNIDSGEDFAKNIMNRSASPKGDYVDLDPDSELLLSVESDSGAGIVGAEFLDVDNDVGDVDEHDQQASSSRADPAPNRSIGRKLSFGESSTRTKTSKVANLPETLKVYTYVTFFWVSVIVFVSLFDSI